MIVLQGVATVRPRPEGGARVVCCGAFDIIRLSTMRQALDEAAGHAGDIVLDLSGVEHLDVAAGAVVAAAALAARRRGDRLAVVPPPGDVGRGLERCGLTELLPA